MSHQIATTRALLALTGVLLVAPAAHAQCDPGDQFGPEQRYTVGNDANRLAIGDMDGDGVSDLIASNSGDGTISVLRGRGDSTFQPLRESPTGGSGPILFSQSVEVGDLNADGIPDVAVAMRGAVFVLLGRGDGTAGPPQNVAQVFFRSTSVATGDLNADGVPDLAFGGADAFTPPGGAFSLAAVGVRLGNGDGTFQPVQIYQASLQSTESGTVQIGDFNADGAPDLLVANPGASQFPPGGTTNASLLLGNGDGTFQPLQEINVGLLASIVRIDDFNGDGALDIAALNTWDIAISVLIGNGDGTFQPRQTFSSIDATYMTIGDINADGVPDIATTGRFPQSTVRVLVGNGDGTFQPSQLYHAFAAGENLISIAIGDLNADGAPDIAASLNPTGVDAVVVLLNQCARPTIVQQPVGVAAGPAQELVSFSVVASSALPRAYQWLRDGVPMIDDANISGSLTPALSILADASDAAAYSCAVSTTSGQVISDAAVLGFRSNPCVADLNTDGLINFFDIATYISIFNAGCP